MSIDRLALSGLLTLFAAALYLVTARWMAHRDVAHTWRRSWMGFVVWWYGIGTVAALTGLALAAASLGHTDEAVFATVAVITRVVLAVALGGLMVHLVRIWGGGPRATNAVVLAYTAFLFVLLYDAVAAVPAPVEAVGWDLASAPAGSSLVTWIVLAGLAGPPVLAAATYGAFALRHSHPRGQVRAATIALGMFAWGATSGLIAMPILDGSDLAQGAFRVFGIAATYLIVFAHRPVAIEGSVPGVHRGWEHVV